MRYHRVVVTAANLSWAINENVHRIEAVLATKRKVLVTAPMQNVDADGYSVRNLTSATDTDVCTLGKFLELRDAN